MFSIAIVGKFQKGKSTLVDCMLGREAAERGRGLRTTAAATAYGIAPGVEIVDTPGFNAEINDDKIALETMEAASAIVLIKEDVGPDELFAATVERIRDLAKPCLLLCNFCNPNRGWTPSPTEGVIAELEAEVDDLHARDSFLAIQKSSSVVIPVNLQWALWSLGLAPESEDDIWEWAEQELGMDLSVRDADEKLRREMWNRSGFPPVRDFLRNLPSHLLRRIVENPGREIDRFAIRFARELTRRWPAA